MAQKKINDDTLLQLIRDGNSPAGAAVFFCRRQAAEMFGKRRQNSTSTSTSLPTDSLCDVLKHDLP
ncbi:MAG: hypothetical protein WAN11_28055 [Syntrophobacteraceae bacterium]